MLSESATNSRNQTSNAHIEAALASIRPRRRGRYRIPEPRRNTVCPHPDGDVLVLAETADTVNYVRVPVRHDSQIRSAGHHAFHAAVAAEQGERRLEREDERIRAGALDDLVTVEVLIAESVSRDNAGAGIDASALVEIFESHQDIQWLASFPQGQPRLLHRLRCSCWPLVEALMREQPALSVCGLDLRAPQRLYPWLATPTARARQSYPTVDVSLAIEYGRRLTLADCRAMDVWIESRWNGHARVDAVDTESGRAVYEVLGDRKRTTERDWLCEFPRAEDAADLAALLNASAPGLLRELAAN